MRAAVAALGWPSDDLSDPSVLGPSATAEAVREAWLAATPGVDLTVVPFPDGGPTSADALAGVRAAVSPGVEGLRVGETLVLAPATGGRWDPVALADALVALAVAGETATIAVPVGDADPAGDAAALWQAAELGESVEPRGAADRRDGADRSGGAVAGLERLRAALAGLRVTVLTTSRRPLLGFQGMSAATRDGREGDAALAAAAQAQEERWTALARGGDALAGAAGPGPARSLIGPTRLSDQPGSGAAGGLAYALAAAGARIVPAGPTLARLTGLAEAAAAADLVAAVVPALDSGELDERGVAVASSLAAARGVPCVAAAGIVAVGRRDLMAGGVAGAHEGRPGLEGLADQVRRLAHTWTPGTRE
ncbi:glycerate kinase [Demequina pelophila]|uniref:glycerate kinase n=1 Tax=Demequina pelophila TaxID=1638984 RepID=UPI00078648F7|nr:glycerate kinase [Demequina pelophila]